MKRALLALAIVGSFCQSQVSAHHSLASEFDESKPLTLQGVIRKIEWLNPHVYIYLEVPNQGRPVTWSLETLPPMTLRRGGLRRDMLGLGQTVTVLAYQGRATANLAFLRKITFADGHEVVVWVGDVKQAK